MSQKQMIWANFSVKDAAATDKFYKQLGFRSNGYNKDLKLASFFFGEKDFVIHFFEQGSRIDEFLASGSDNTSEIIFTLSAETEQEVRDFASRVKEAGGRVIKEVRRDEDNYFGFAFADPDGHKFNMLLMDNM